MQREEKWFSVKILTYYRNKIEQYVGIGKQFSSTSSFIDSAISDKLDRLQEAQKK